MGRIVARRRAVEGVCKQVFRFAAKAGLAAVLTLGIGACAPRADGQTRARASAPDAFAKYVYPAAQPVDPNTFIAKDADRVRTIAGFTTADAFAKVYAYYRKHLPSGSETMRVVSGNGSVATFYFVDSPGARQAMAVQISSDKPNVTQILLTRYGSRFLKSSDRELMQ